MEEFFSSSNEETQKIAGDFAKTLKAGDIILLDGDLGAGKTVFTKGIVSMLSNGKEVTLADILVDEKMSVSNEVERENLKNDIVFIVNKLKQREADVVRMRFGLNDLRKYTLEEIGNIYGVTKECIRQTEKRAISKIRMIIEKEGLLAGYSA